MPTHHDDDDLPTLDTTDLSRVTGGAGDAMSSMLPMMMMMMMRNRAQPAVAPAPAPAPGPPQGPAWRPRIFVDGVEQQPTMTDQGMMFSTSTPL